MDTTPKDALALEPTTGTEKRTVKRRGKLRPTEAEVVAECVALGLEGDDGRYLMAKWEAENRWPKGDWRYAIRAAKYAKSLPSLWESRRISPGNGCGLNVHTPDKRRLPTPDHDDRVAPRHKPVFAKGNPPR